MMTLSNKIDTAKNLGISVNYDISQCESLVGVYKFFYCIDNRRVCFYIGRSTDIVDRLFGSSNGHVFAYLTHNLDNLVPKKIDEYLKLGYKIEVDIIEVDYRDTDFSRASHRLALAEISEIVKHQEKGECLFQIPEGFNSRSREHWEKYYRIEE